MEQGNVDKKKKPINNIIKTLTTFLWEILNDNVL